MDYDEILKKAEELVAQAQKTWQSDEVQSKVIWARKVAKEIVDKFPLGSIAGAILLGFIIGRLLRNDEDE